MDKLIKKLKQKIKNDHSEQQEDSLEILDKYINEFVGDSNKSPLEKAFFLFLNQFSSDNKDYIVCANENVLIPNIYDSSTPGIKHEIDFALYGGSIDNPIKVAIECDGLRSHGHRKVKRDRRKDVNLQPDGWIVMRFTSREIHEELNNFNTKENYTCDFLESIENTIREKLKIINYQTYIKTDFRSKLTGYKWGKVTCTNCNFTQEDTLNHKKIICRKCKTKYEREIKYDEKIKYEVNGILFF